MRIDVLTLFPDMFTAPMSMSMMWKARENNHLDFHAHDIRDYALDKHRKVDDTPYGGGGGMVLRPDVVVNAVDHVRGAAAAPVILMSPQGRLFTHQLAAELSQQDHLILLCGHYEGFDERIRQLVVDDEISIGDYVLTGGELAAMVVIDAVVRQIPGVLGAEGAHQRDSHADGLLEGPHYTRPAEFQGLGIPDVLRQGNHGMIDRWRRLEAIRRTWENRPELLMTAELSAEEKHFLSELANDSAMKREA